MSPPPPAPRYQPGQRWSFLDAPPDMDASLYVWSEQPEPVFDEYGEASDTHLYYQIAVTFHAESAALYELNGLVLLVSVAVLDASVTGDAEPGERPEWLPEPGDWVREQIRNDYHADGPLSLHLRAIVGELRGLDHAIENGRHNLITQLLIEDPAVASQPFADGSTPLHRVAYSPQDHLAALLLLYGGDPNARNAYGHTPLHSAALHGKIEMMRTLLDAGADPEARDQEDFTPLQRATQASLEPTLRCARLLLARGAEPDLYSLAVLGEFSRFRERAETAEDLGQSSILVVGLVIGVEFGLQFRREETGEDVEDALDAILPDALDSLTLILERGANFNAGDALYHAIRLPTTEIARLLLENGADPNSQESQGILLPDLTYDPAMKALLAQYGAANKNDPERLIPDMTRNLLRVGRKDATKQVTDWIEARAIAWRAVGQYERAVADFDDILRRAPKNYDGLNELAWMLATCPDERFRDPTRAVKLARKAVRLGGHQIFMNSGGPLDVFFRTEFRVTLAAALAQVGKFDDALMQVSSALSLASKKRREDALRMNEHLQSGQPFLEPTPTPERLELGKRLAEQVDALLRDNPPVEEDNTPAPPPPLVLNYENAITIQEEGFGLAGMQRLLAVPNRADTTFLQIYYSGIGDEEIALLASSFDAPRMTRLDLRSNRITPHGLRLLVESNLWPTLTNLELDNNPLGNEAGPVLAASPILERLRTLSLGTCRLRAAGLEALASSPNLRHLTTLTVSGNRIRDEGLRLLLTSPHLSSLQSLSLGTCRLGPVAGALLRDAAPASLTELQLYSNRLGGRGLSDLSECKNLKLLRILSISRNRIGPEGIARLAASPNFAGLTNLEISTNPLGVEGVRALADSPHLRNLAKLDVMSCRIGEEGAVALAESVALDRVQHLLISAGEVGPRGLRYLQERYGNRVEAR